MAEPSCCAAPLRKGLGGLGRKLPVLSTSRPRPENSSVTINVFGDAVKKCMVLLPYHTSINEPVDPPVPPTLTVQAAPVNRKDSGLSLAGGADTGGRCVDARAGPRATAHNLLFASPPTPKKTAKNPPQHNGPTPRGPQ